MTSFPRSDLTSSIHFDVERKEVRSNAKKIGHRAFLKMATDTLVMSNTTIATEESRM